MSETSEMWRERREQRRSRPQPRRGRAMRAEPSAWIDAVREAVGAILNAESPEEEARREQEESARLWRIACEALAAELEAHAEEWPLCPTCAIAYGTGTKVPPGEPCFNCGWIGRGQGSGMTPTDSPPPAEDPAAHSDSEEGE